MAKNQVVVKMNNRGCNALRNSEGVQAYLLSQAERIRSAADSVSAEYTADVQPGRTRAHAMVKTTDYASRMDNAKNNTLLKAMGR